MSYLRRGVATATVSVFASLGPPLATGAACHIDERQRLMGSSSTRATEESVNRPERQSYLMCFVTSSSCLGRHLHLCICLRGGGCQTASAVAALCLPAPPRDCGRARAALRLLSWSVSRRSGRTCAAGRPSPLPSFIPLPSYDFS